MNIKSNENGMVSMDFITAVGVLLMTFLYAAYTISSIMTPYAGFHSKELYPAADRTSSLLIEDPGYYDTGSDFGTNWQSVWFSNQTYVKKIGFKIDDNNKTIDSNKFIFMKSHPGIDNYVSWWEYPATFEDTAEPNNISRGLGLERYNFYIQIRPIDDSKYNVTEADAAAKNKVGDVREVAAVTRLSFIEHEKYGDFDGAHLKGTLPNAKVLLGLEPENFHIIKDGIRFRIFNWSLVDKDNTDYQNIVMGNRLEDGKNVQDPGTQLKIDSDYYLTKNNVNVTLPSLPTHLNESDYLEFFIPRSTLDDKLPTGWETSGNTIYFQLNVQVSVIISEVGVTFFSSTKDENSYPVKTTLWVW